MKKKMVFKNGALTKMSGLSNSKPHITYDSMSAVFLEKSK